MKIVHHIGINPDIDQRLTLMGLGIDIPFSKSNLTGAVAIELEESSDEYKKIQPYLELWKVMDATATLFTEAEVRDAPFLAMRDVWANGYPMPDNNFGYMDITYNSSDYCKECGIGLVQKEPFRIKKEPNWGGKNMFSLNWVYDELFVKPELYENVFKKYNIKTMPVLLYKKDTVLENVVQLQIAESNANLELEGNSYIECGSCGRIRYDMVTRGFFPSFKELFSRPSIVKTKEFFGTGKNARKYIVISSQILEELNKYKIKCNFIPMNQG